MKGTFSNYHYKRANLIFPSILDKVVDSDLSEIETGYEPSVTVSRRKAMMFADSGKVDHTAT